MAAFLSELKRRKVFRLALVYLVVAWVLVQIVATVEAPLNLPNWVDTFIIVLLAVGFPIALIMSWAFDVTPAGLVKTQAPEENTEPSAPAPDDTNDVSTDTAAEVLHNSVAVLPFENLSPDPEDAYFAAGIHEEILSYLTKIKDLSVIARTSVRKYADTEKSISEIARELGVGTVMEGSVRYAGERVRVTAQLIDAATDNHLWSEVYERDLADVFAIQADIAARIAEALEAELSAAELQGIESLPATTSPEAHALYLKAQTLFGQDDTAIAVTGAPDIRARIQSTLDQAIELDPGFAHPYALKAVLYPASKLYDPIKKEDWLKKSVELDESARSNAEKALALNANLGLAHFALALNHQINWRWGQAREAYNRALELRPNDSNILGWYSLSKWLTEDYDEAVHLGKKAVALDPGNSYIYIHLSMALQSAGDYRAAADLLENWRKANPGSALAYLQTSWAQFALGDNARALEGVRLAEQLMPDEVSPDLHIAIAYGFGILEQQDDAKRMVTKVESAIGDRFVDPIVQVWRYLATQDSDEALQWLRKAVEEPEYRQEIFVRGFVKENMWSDPVLEQSDFAKLRAQLKF